MIPFESLSYWEHDQYLKNIDVLIVGAGIVGLTTAIHLKKNNPNKKVLVVERGYLPLGASTKNAGFACIDSALEIIDDFSKFSVDEVWATVQQRWEGLQYLKELTAGADIGYEHGKSYELLRKNDLTNHRDLDDQLNALNDRLYKITGIKNVYQQCSDVLNNTGMQGFEQMISNAAEGRLDTGKLMLHLLRQATELGVLLLNTVNVLEINENIIRTSFGSIEFNKAAICSNGLAKALINQDVLPARAQVIVTRPIQGLTIEGSFHFDRGYYYFRNVNQRLLFGGGRQLDFQSETTTSLETTKLIQDHLLDLLNNNILPNHRFEIERKWAGIMGVGKRKKAIIKKTHPNIYCAVRLGGMGIAIGSGVGKRLAQLIES